LGASRSVDYRLGIKLHRMFRDAGFGDPKVRFDQPVYATGEAKRFWEYTFLEAAPVIVQAGLATHDEIQELKRELAAVAENPSIMVAQARKVQVWARK